LSKTVLVTGAAGFIGSHLSEALLARGDAVVGLDNLNDYYDPARKQGNLEEVRSGAASPDLFRFIEGDIRNRPAVTQLFEQTPFDAVVHLAAMPGVRASVSDPHLYHAVNVVGTLNLLEAARSQQPQPNFVFASTSSVYGRTEAIPFTESDACDRPLAPYPASKRSAEMLGHTVHHLHGLSFTALRLFTVYGPRNRPDMMPYLVLNNIFFDQQVPLYGGGALRRDWTYVGDTVAGILAAVDRPLGYEIVNLGHGEPVLLSDFVELVEHYAGRKASLDRADMPETDPSLTHADISKARQLLGYSPSISVDEGIRRFWEWYQRAVLQRG
jgi:UDP-glucuronate 4-epimerase